MITSDDSGASGLVSYTRSERKARALYGSSSDTDSSQIDEVNIEKRFKQRALAAASSSDSRIGPDESYLSVDSGPMVSRALCIPFTQMGKCKGCTKQSRTCFDVHCSGQRSSYSNIDKYDGVAQMRWVQKCIGVQIRDMEPDTESERGRDPKVIAMLP